MEREQGAWYETVDLRVLVDFGSEMRPGGELLNRPSGKPPKKGDFCPISLKWPVPLSGQGIILDHPQVLRSYVCPTIGMYCLLATSGIEHPKVNHLVPSTLLPLQTWLIPGTK